MPVGSASAILGFDNRIDDATVTVASAADRAAALQDRSLGEAWESETTAEADTWIEATYERPVPARLVSLHGTNLSVEAQYRVQGWLDAGKTDLVVDSGVLDVCPPLVPVSERDWGRLDLWSGKPTARDWRRLPRSVIHPLPGVRRAKVWRISLVDEGNVDATVRVARPFIGDAIQFRNTMDLGMTLGWETFAQVQQGPGGQREGSEARPGRSASIALSWLNEGERRLMISAMTIAGETGEVVWVPHPDVPAKLQLESWLGYIRSRTLRRVRNSEDTTGLAADIRELV